VFLFCFDFGFWGRGGGLGERGVRLWRRYLRFHVSLYMCVLRALAVLIEVRGRGGEGEEVALWVEDQCRPVW